jgi:hypothetical protein
MGTSNVISLLKLVGGERSLCIGDDRTQLTAEVPTLSVIQKCGINAVIVNGGQD